MHDKLRDNISKIARAAIYYELGYVPELLLWYATGELYSIYAFSEHYTNVYIIESTPTVPSLSPAPFAFSYHGFIMIEHYNAILTRVEDIYGMSIDEFSLGLLSYE